MIEDTIHPFDLPDWPDEKLRANRDHVLKLLDQQTDENGELARQLSLLTAEIERRTR